MKPVYKAVSGGLNELLTLWKKDTYTEDQARSIAFYYVHSLEPRGLAMPKGTSW
jgi:hypothetical protein